MNDTEIIESITTSLKKEGGCQWFGPKIMDEATFNSNFRPKDKQECGLEGIEFEWVDQKAQGMDGDSFYGRVAWPLPSGKYFTLGFDM